MSRSAWDQCRFTEEWTDALGYYHYWRCKKLVVARKRCRVHLSRQKTNRVDFAATVAKRREQARHEREARLGAHVILRVRQKAARREKA